MSEFERIMSAVGDANGLRYWTIGFTKESFAKPRREFLRALDMELRTVRRLATEEFDRHQGERR